MFSGLDIYFLLPQCFVWVTDITPSDSACLQILDFCVPLKYSCFRILKFYILFKKYEFEHSLFFLFFYLFCFQTAFIFRCNFCMTLSYIVISKDKQNSFQMRLQQKQLYFELHCSLWHSRDFKFLFQVSQQTAWLLISIVLFHIKHALYVIRL